MIFLEGSARTWLIVHALVGAATVAACTHLVLWTRTYWRGDLRRFPAARRFAAIAFAFYAAQFTIGNLIYPVFKVRVRAEFLDDPAAIRADTAARNEARAQVARRANVTPPAPRVPRDLAGVARVFDIKEHWVALGLALSAGAFAVAWWWKPAREGTERRHAGRLLFALALGAALCAWAGALVGFYVASVRAVG